MTIPTTLKPGLYEQIINKKLYETIEGMEDLAAAADLPAPFDVSKEPLDLEEARKHLAAYIGHVTRKALQMVREQNRDEGEALLSQIRLCNQLIQQLAETLPAEEFDALAIGEEGEVLTAVVEKINSSRSVMAHDVIRPVTPLSESSLFTGSHYEPSMIEEIKREIVSCDQIDWLVSFIKWSGLRCMMEELKTFTHGGGQLRVITTSYMGATDYKAVEELSKLPNTQVKVSYDTKRTRLHAKSYHFKRETGFSTVYIGSSNVSNPALTSGLEWNIKVTERDSFDIIKKCEATFESYWNDKEFVAFNGEIEADREQLQGALRPSTSDDNDAFAFMNIDPYPYQKEILEKLQVEREVHGYHRNLLVAATGVGKTVIAAFDYKRQAKKQPGRSRLLFVAHREEILRQSLQTFRYVLRDPNFGDLLVGGHMPTQVDHLFISIQSFNSKDFTQHTSADFYDFIIVDEFHHAKADSYQALLGYYQPSILLGLTATPERMDGKNVLDYFDHRIASEMRLPEAVDRKLLSPFQYFAVSDTVDYSQLSWKRGGYEQKELSNILTQDDFRVKQILSSLHRYVTDMNQVIGLGFCVSIEHAEFMAMRFNEAGIPSMALHSEVKNEERKQAQRRLTSGKLTFIFTVDLYNEGVDIPELNTILFLRPTESLTVFLQQLGRGLRIAEDKECLTVLDFVGQAHKKYNYEEKFRALLGKTNHSVKHYVEKGFSKLPRGCYIQMEKQAKEYVLQNIKNHIINRANMVAKMQYFEADTGKELTLKHFLEHYQLSVNDFYGTDRTGKRLFHSMKVEANASEPLQWSKREVLAKRISGLFHVDSVSFLRFIRKVLQGEMIQMEADQLQIAMLYYTFYLEPPHKEGFSSMWQGIADLLDDPWTKAELIEMVDHLYHEVSVMEIDHDLSYQCPLKVHARYSMNQIMAAFGYYNEEKRPAFREGVKYFEEKQTDVFFVTLNKSEKDFSPSTLYEDYAISEQLFHWQTQSRTRSSSATAKRYVHHRQQDHQIALFVRDRKKENGYASPFVFLGTAEYVKHEGDAPMSFVWRLKEEMPSYFLPKANKNVL